MRLSRSALLAVVAVGGLALAACGDDSTKSPANGGGSVTTIDAMTETPTTVDAMMESPTTVDAMMETPTTVDKMTGDKMTETPTTGA